MTSETENRRPGACPFCKRGMGGPLVIDAVLHIGGSHPDELLRWLDNEMAAKAELAEVPHA